MNGLTKKEVLNELRKIGYTTLSELKDQLREYERYADSIDISDSTDMKDDADSRKNIVDI